jgi:hypothetical protein
VPEIVRYYPAKSNSALNVSKCRNGAVSKLTGSKVKDGYARKLLKTRQENYWSGLAVHSSIVMVFRNMSGLRAAIADPDD